MSPFRALQILFLFSVFRPTHAADQDMTPPRALGREFEVYQAPKDPTAAGRSLAVPEAPEGPLTLRSALAEALVKNPTLATFSWEVRVREARMLQAGLFPNPVVETTVENFGGGQSNEAFEETETTVWLSQLIELGGKRVKRRRLAGLGRDLAGWDFETRRLDVFADVTKAFVAVVALEERSALADELVRVARQSVDTVAATVTAGAVSPVEERRARVAAERAELERVQVERELDAARSTLAAAIGVPGPTFGRATGDLTAVAPPPPLQELLARIDESPEIARWTAELEERRAALSLEESQRIPDVSIAPGIRRFHATESNAVVLGVTVPLPLFNRNQGGVLEAQYRVAKANAEQHAAEVSVRGLLGAAHGRLAAAFQQVTALRERVIPQARSVYEESLDAYQRGRFRYLEVLDAQRTFFELRGQYVGALAAYHQAVTDVERLTGAPLGAPHLREEGAGR